MSNIISTYKTSSDTDSFGPTHRIGRRIGMVLFASLLAVMSLLGPSVTPASASMTLSHVTCERPGGVYTTVGINAPREVQDGGQYVSVRYFLRAAAGGQYDFGYRPYFLAPRLGTATTFESFYVQWGWTQVYVNVRYWNGQSWDYNSTWTRIDNGVCLA